MPLTLGTAPLALAALAGLFLAAVPDRDGPWVGTWAAAPQRTEPANLPPPPGLADTTLRQVVHVSVGGARLRVRFSNAFGAAPLTLTSVHVALPAGPGAVRPDTDRPITFQGAASVTIPPGAPMISDPVAFPVAPLSDLAVTVHVRDPSPAVTGHPGARATTYLRAGDAVSAPTLPGAATTEHWYYLCGVDVEAGPDAAAAAILGDSLTDGRGSTTDGNGRWPDALARRLHADRRTAQVGVLNVGIGGNRVLADGLGPGALSRLDRDVLAQPGVRWLVVLEGINDLGTGAGAAPELVAAYTQIVRRAHARGIKVYGGTITPCGGSFYDRPALEAAREAINAWTRAPGHFDAVVDFDAAVRDPRDTTRLRADADSGDHLHLNDAGYRRMAEAVDPGLFQERPRAGAPGEGNPRQRTRRPSG